MKLDLSSEKLASEIREELDSTRAKLREEKGHNNNHLASQYIGYIDALEWILEKVEWK